MSADLPGLLSHRPPMLLLDAVHENADGRAVAGWTVPAGSPWVEGGRLVRAAFVEVAAQTAALTAAAVAASRAPRTGFLLGITEFRVHGDAVPGDVLRATARLAARYGPLSRFECTVERDGPAGRTLLAEGALSVAVATT
jgi:predicted hotdog family 3-hydroxylacyl-ACP dehydratase